VSSCPRCVVALCLSKLGWGKYLHYSPKIPNNEECSPLFGCNVAVGNVAPGVCIREIRSGGAHLGSSSPGSVHGGWQSFVSCGRLWWGLLTLWQLSLLPHSPAIVVCHCGCCCCVRHYRYTLWHFRKEPLTCHVVTTMGC
jgi:hypothetical protein